MMQKEIQIATCLNLELLRGRYSQPIAQSAALILTQVSHEAQTDILDRLAKKGLPFTTKNIQAAVSAHQKTHKPRSTNGNQTSTDSAHSALSASPHKSKPLHDDAPQLIAPRYNGLPDLSMFDTVGKICLDLLDFPWSPETIALALATFTNLAEAVTTLVDHMRDEKLKFAGGAHNILQAVK
jgi:hypothetical protein